MPRHTPFHPRTAERCHSYAWKEWAGHVAVCNFDRHSEREYYAIRQSAGLFDASPLYKYEITGSDASLLLSTVWTRDIAKLREGRVTYAAMCDERGKLLDDGTVAHLGPNHFRIAISEPALHWLLRHARGMSVEIEESTARWGCLALQGPLSRDVLRAIVDFDIDAMKLFAVAQCSLSGVPIWLSRTGYTGDLGFEIWVAADRALPVWDAIVEAGTPYGLEPVGLDALDVARIEAGFIMQGVDYISSRLCQTESRKSSPFEAGLGFAVNLERDNFVGQAALVKESKEGSNWDLVGIELSWPALEKLHESSGVPPHLAPVACRQAVPIYDRLGRQVGQCTSNTWSPTLKRYIGLAQVHCEHAALGTELKMEYTVDYQRHRLPVTVVQKPFFDPPRKRQTVRTSSGSDKSSAAPAPGHKEGLS